MPEKGFPGMVWKNKGGISLLDSVNQGRGIALSVPNVNNMYNIFSLVVVIDNLKSTIHNMTTSMRNFKTIKQFF